MKRPYSSWYQGLMIMPFSTAVLIGDRKLFTVLVNPFSDTGNQRLKLSFSKPPQETEINVSA
jgi:hypothetical protein